MMVRGGNDLSGVAARGVLTEWSFTVEHPHAVVYGGPTRRDIYIERTENTRVRLVVEVLGTAWQVHGVDTLGDVELVLRPVKKPARKRRRSRR